MDGTSADIANGEATPCVGRSALMRRAGSLKKSLFVFSVVIVTGLVTNNWRPIVDSTPPLPLKPQHPEVVIDFNGIALLSTKTLNVSLTRIVPPYFPLTSLYFTAERYHLATCAILKNMATIQWAIFCYLKDPLKFATSYRSITLLPAWNLSLCTTEHYRLDVHSAMESLGPNMTLFTVVRHPIDRFISGYTDRCLTNTRFKTYERCFGCQSDLKCFVEKMHETLIDYYYNSTGTTSYTQHLINHFAPQNWYCEFEKYRTSYKFINYHMGPNGTRKVAEEINAVLMQAEVEPEFRAAIFRQMIHDKTPHTTMNSMLRRGVQRQLLSDVYLMKHIMEMYFFDFINLGFT